MVETQENEMVTEDRENDAMDCSCGLPMTKNPHPQAGNVKEYLKVGAVYECIPCLVKSRHGWAENAQRNKAAIGKAIKMERDACIQAALDEHLHDPQNEEDAAYDRAIDDVVNALRARGRCICHQGSICTPACELKHHDGCKESK